MELVSLTENLARLSTIARDTHCELMREFVFSAFSEELQENLIIALLLSQSGESKTGVDTSVEQQHKK